MPPSSNFFLEFLGLTRQFWNSKEKVKIRGAALLFAILTMLQMGMAILITQWNAGLFDALEQHSMQGVIQQSGLLVLLFCSGMLLTGLHLTVKRHLQINWREWLTKHVASLWMRDGRHYLLDHLSGAHDNPDGRIAEDCRIATESAVVLGHSLFYSILLLIGFTRVLWSHSGVVTLHLGTFSVPVHGHMVWVALFYAALASWLGWRVSRPLIGATNNRQTAEANFRASLLEAQENSQTIALIHAESCERHQFREHFNNIRSIWNAQTRAWRHILMFGTGYSVLSMAFPILISSPRYILGAISLGVLMQSAQAFQHMVSALSWPVNSAGAIAEWRASVERVLSLLRTLENLDKQLDQPSQLIQVQKGDGEALIFRNLSLMKHDGTVLTNNISMEINLGEHVLISGNIFTGAKLFRAIAGIRPWGSGTIELPSHGRLFFMPPRPHLPVDTLRNTICYPVSRRVFSQGRIEDAMSLAGLAHLIAHLEQKTNWKNTLALGEQQRLGMVRLLINHPQWVFLDQAFDSMDNKDEAQMFNLICAQIPQVTILAITHMPDSGGFFTRRLTL
ncbi:MAG: ABC transporter ATP-binding protein/permease [Desulfobulbaceae bacterium]|nr:ABC transporter ATP-binding protein/permease [Desulfobulbaceae bacterium]